MCKPKQPIRGTRLGPSHRFDLPNDSASGLTSLISELSLHCVSHKPEFAPQQFKHMQKRQRHANPPITYTILPTKSIPDTRRHNSANIRVRQHIPATGQKNSAPQHFPCCGAVDFGLSVNPFQAADAGVEPVCLTINLNVDQSR